MNQSMTLKKLIVGILFWVTMSIAYGLLGREIVVQSDQELDQAIAQYDRAVVMVGGNPDRFERLSDHMPYEQGELAFIEYITQENDSFSLYKNGHKIVDIHDFTNLRPAIENYFGKEIQDFIDHKERLIATIPQQKQIYYWWPYYDYYYPWLNWYPVYEIYGFWPYFYSGYRAGRHNYRWERPGLHPWKRSEHWKGRRGKVFGSRRTWNGKGIRPVIHFRTYRARYSSRTNGR